MNTRVVGVFVCLLVASAFAADPPVADLVSGGGGDAPAPVTVTDAPTTPPPTTTTTDPTDGGSGTVQPIDVPAEPEPKPTIRPDMYPIGTLKRHVHPPRIGLEQDKYRRDVRYYGGGRAATPEQAFARSRQLDPRVTADVVGRQRKEFVTPHYAPEAVWDVYQDRASWARRHRQRRVPVDVITHAPRRRHQRRRPHLGGKPRPKFEDYFRNKKKNAARRRGGRRGRRTGRRSARRSTGRRSRSARRSTGRRSRKARKPRANRPRRSRRSVTRRPRAFEDDDDEPEYLHVTPVYDAPYSDVRMIPRKPMSGRVEAHAVDSVEMLPPVWRHTHEAEVVNRAADNRQTVIVGDIKQWVDRELAQLKRRRS